ncbi:MAG: DUF4339 domain-containing protein [Verrucomicrobiota bacterium]|nr:DUF4339 domain-containing protein [Verrucomicrobiota bacterium]
MSSRENLLKLTGVNTNIASISQSMHWYYIHAGEQGGPIEDACFREKMDRGEIFPDDFVWNSNFGPEWKLLKDVVPPPTRTFVTVQTPPLDGTPLPPCEGDTSPPQPPQSISLMKKLKSLLGKSSNG